MKKKGLLVVGSAFIVVAIIAMCMFAFGGNRDEVQTAQFTPEGTWKVVAYTDASGTSVVDNEFMVFEDEQAYDYRDGEETPFVSSAFSVENNSLVLGDISKEYLVEKKTDHYFRLCEGKDIYMDLISYQNDDMGELEVEDDILAGTWEIVFRNTDQVYAGDTLVFDANGQVSQYKAGSQEPAASSDYEQTGNRLVVSGWGKEMTIYPVDEETVILVETMGDTGFVWELKKAE